MDWTEIITQVLSFIAGGGIVGIFTIRAKKKKADVEVKVDEIKALHDTIDLVYKPIIDEQNETISRQNVRIQELDTEIKALRKQINDERADHQREIDLMNKRILAITSALGLKASAQIRDERGRYAKADIEEEGNEA